MKKYVKEIIIIFLQFFMFYIFPLFAGPGDEMGLVVLLLASTLIFGFLMGSISEHKVKYGYPLAAAFLFLPTIVIYYNASAIIHAAWYMVVSSIGLLLGAFLQFGCNKMKKLGVMERKIMKNKLFFILFLIVLCFIGWFGYSYIGIDKETQVPKALLMRIRPLP